MQNMLFLTFMYFTEWLVVHTYAKSIFKKRMRFSVLLSMFFYALLMLAYRYVPQIEILNLIFTIFCNILCIFICFKSTLKSAIFHAVVLVITQFVSEVIAIYLVSQLSSSPADSYNDSSIIFMTEIIICRFLYFSICRLLLKFSSKETSTYSWGRWASLSILPISSSFIIIVFRIITKDVIFSLEENIICILSFVILLIANIVIYAIYEKAEKSSQKLFELELATQKNEINIRYLELLEAKNEKINIMVHDYKNHLVAISNMSDSEDVKKYIDSMIDDVSKYNRIAKTKNKWLDLIINKYTEMCDSKGITFDVNVSSDNLIFIDSYDLSALFNNILDNAYEAVMKSDEKFIYLEITKVLNSYHKIVIKNSSDNEPKTHNKRLLSSKKIRKFMGLERKAYIK